MSTPQFTALKDFPVFGMAKRFDHAPSTVQEALEISELDFTVEKKPIIVEVTNHAGEVVDMVRSSEHFAMVRSDTNTVLGTGRSRYKVVQNRDAFLLLDSLAASGQIKYLAIGQLNGGAKIVLFAEVTSLTFDVVTGDQIKTMIMVSLSHDGTCAILIGQIAARMACFNLNPTLKSAVRGGDGVSIRHCGDIEAKMVEAGRVMSIVTQSMKQYKEQAQWLAGQRISKRFVQAYLDFLFPMPEDGSERTVRAQNQWDLLYTLCDRGRGTEIPGVRGSRWGLLNALTEWTNHERSSRAIGTQVNSLLFGNGAQINQKGMRYLMSAANNGEL